MRKIQDFFFEFWSWFWDFTAGHDCVDTCTSSHLVYCGAFSSWCWRHGFWARDRCPDYCSHSARIVRHTFWSLSDNLFQDASRGVCPSWCGSPLQTCKDARPCPVTSHSRWARCASAFSTTVTARIQCGLREPTQLRWLACQVILAMTKSYLECRFWFSTCFSWTERIQSTHWTQLLMIVVWALDDNVTGQEACCRAQCWRFESTRPQSLPCQVTLVAKSCYKMPHFLVMIVAGPIGEDLIGRETRPTDHSLPWLWLLRHTHGAWLRWHQMTHTSSLWSEHHQ